MKELEITRFPLLDYACNESMNSLCTSLSYCGSDVRTIMITSRYTMEGKSFVSMNLMRSLAGLKRCVVLVDADLRCSGIHASYKLRFPDDNKLGLADYLAGLCEAEDILYATNIPNAFLIPAGRDVANSLQLIETQRMGKLMRSLAEQFDLVLVDTPPAGIIVDAIAVARHCDGALIVVSYNRGKRQDLADIVADLKKTGVRVLGAVLNNVEFKNYSNRKYYYRSERYSSYYSKKYAYRYGYNNRSVGRGKKNKP